MASDTVSRIYACLHALCMLCSYQDVNRCAIWTCAIHKQISRHVGHSMHGCISVPCFEHRPHCEHVKIFRNGAFCSDNSLEPMNKRYKEGLSLEKVPLSTPSPSLACPARLMHVTRQAVGQPSGAPLRRGVHHSPSPEKFAGPAAGKVRFCENNGACRADLSPLNRQATAPGKRVRRGHLHVLETLRKFLERCGGLDSAPR